MWYYSVLLLFKNLDTFVWDLLDCSQCESVLVETQI